VRSGDQLIVALFGAILVGPGVEDQFGPQPVDLPQLQSPVAAMEIGVDLLLLAQPLGGNGRGDPMCGGIIAKPGFQFDVAHCTPWGEQL
jgi:hypothetical protein